LDADILRDLGKAYFSMGDYANALNTLRGALAFNAKDPEGRFLLGRAQMETGDLEVAVTTFTELLNTTPDYLPGTYYLGQTYGKLGNLAEAHYHLGMYYKKKRRFDNASFHLNRALKLFAKDPARRKAIKEALKGLPTRQGRDHNEKSAW
jgi:tetratricopeptide (TPR) repeat protein